MAGKGNMRDGLGSSSVGTRVAKFEYGCTVAILIERESLIDGDTVQTITYLDLACKVPDAGWHGAVVI
jgi:hypothetical protein